MRTNGKVKEVKHITKISCQNFLLVGISRFFVKTINPKIMPATAKRIVRERRGGKDSIAIFTAAQDDPQITQITTKPISNFRRNNIS